VTDAEYSSHPVFPPVMTFNASDSSTDQGLPDDLPPLPGMPFGILLVSALGWLFAITGLIALPWPLPGTPPTSSGSHLLRFATPIPNEAPLAAIIRHGSDVLPYAIILVVPLSMVLATGWRRSRLAVRLLTIFGLLGVIYAIGVALQFGPMVFIVGCIMIATSGWLGWSLPVVSYTPPIMARTSDQPYNEPMAVPSDRMDYGEVADVNQIPDHVADQAVGDMADNSLDHVTTPAEAYPDQPPGDQLSL